MRSTPLARSVLLSMAAVAALQSQPSAVLKVTILNGSSNSPVGFAQIEVDTPAGKRLASGFATAQGTADFSLPEGKYLVLAKSNTISQCGTQSRGTLISLCAGRASVSVKAAAEPTETSIVIGPPAVSSRW